MKDQTSFRFGSIETIASNLVIPAKAGTSVPLNYTRILNFLLFINVNDDILPEYFSIKTVIMNGEKVVILIDDDPLIHAVFELFIMSCNCKLISIMDANKALEYAENPATFDKPSLLFVDFKMGLVSGTDLIKKMRLQKYFDNIPIILFTGYDHEEEDLAHLKLADVLKKPSSKEDVLRSIEREYQVS